MQIDKKNFCELNWAMTSPEVIALHYYKKVSTARKYSCHQSRREERLVVGSKTDVMKALKQRKQFFPLKEVEMS